MKLRDLLVVDDEVELAEIISEMVGENGVSTVCAHDGQAALDMFAEHNFDAVLCDLSMPKMNGLEFISALRRAGNDVPVVILSAHQDLTRVQEALRLGAFDYLVKPFAKEELLGVVFKAVEIGARHRRLREALASGKADLTDPERERHFINLLKAANIKRTA